MGNRWYTQFFGTLHKKPVLMDCNFIVDSTNGNGLGIRSLNGAGISGVYMKTSASFSGATHTNTVIDSIADTSSLAVGMPLSGTGIAAGTVIQSITSSTAIVVTPATTGTATVTINYAGVGSPTPTGPGTGYILVKFQDNFNYYLHGTSGFISPQSGSNISISGSSVMTIGKAYVITSVGTSTQANWNAVGLPLGVIPAVGEAFIATVTGGGTGTGVVQASSVSGISHLEVVGDPNQTFGANYNGAAILGGSAGSYLIAQCLAPTLTVGAYTPAGTISTPTLTMNSYTPAGTNNSATPPIFAGTPATLTGSISTPTFTGTPASLTATSAYLPAAPANGSVVSMTFYMSNSYITVQGG